MLPLVNAVISSILGPVVSKAASLAAEELINLWGVGEEIRNISEKLQLIQTVLEDADGHGTISDSMRLLLERLKDVAYDIDDMLDDCATEAALRPRGLVQEADEGACLIKWKRRACDSLCLVSDCCLSCCFMHPTRVSFRRELANNIKSVRGKLDRIQQDVQFVNLKRLVEGETRQTQRRRTWARPETAPVLEKGWSPVGRDKEMRKIKKQLLAGACVDKPEEAGPSGANPSVIAIVGFGGLGKTTLAQAIFNDQKVKDSFAIKKWLFVGENFDAKKLIKDILSDGNKTRNLGETLGDLQTELIKVLEDNRFLIILDDVWSENPQDWDPLWRPLTHGKEGSMIILTTRNRKVAHTKGRPTTYVLEGLSDEECWKIFEGRAFPDENSRGDPELETLGKQIVEKLKGVPLAASMMGGFLGGFLHDKEEWKSVLNSNMWPQTREGDPIDHVIGVSYQHLPWHLRQCFAYCSVFPKDYVFDKPTLIQMWMASGYIQPQRGRRPEDAGSNYFDDLHHASFFQYIEGKYVMHDLVHDFAQKVFEEGHQPTTAGRDDRSVSEQVRHLSVSSNTFSSELSMVEELRKLKKLRTFRLKWRGSVSRLDIVFLSRLDILFTEFKYVRVLELVGREISELPDSIGQLRLLRYLDIRGTGITTLPKPVCNLCNLQTLMLPFLHYDLPQGMSKLVNLRHLNEYEDAISRIKNIGKLTLLQGLEVFVVGKDSGRKITELHNMNDLRGKLAIRDLRNVAGREEAELANLTSKVHLEKLQLVWWYDGWAFEKMSDGSLEGRQLRDSDVLEGLLLPPNLKKLRIQNNVGVQLPTWMMQQQPLPSSLVSFRLKGCSFLKHLPPLGQLPSLKEVRVENCPGIQCLPEGGLPSSLKRLVIYDCPRLVKHCRERGLSQPMLIYRREHIFYIRDEEHKVISIQTREASVSGILALVASKAASLSIQQFIKAPSGVEEGIRNLSEKLQSIQAVLEDAMIVDTEYGMSELIGPWLERLEDVADDADDMLDDCAIHLGDDRAIHLGECFILNSTHASFHRDIANRLKSIRERLDAIEKDEHHFSQSQPRRPYEWKTTPFQKKGRLLIGRDKEMKEIKEEMFAYDLDKCETSTSATHGQQQPSARNVSVIAIVGTVGIGKTTLAQAIFDDEEVKASFSMRKWLLVGEDFEGKRLIKDIIDDGGNTQINVGENLVDLQKQLIDKLKGNRCLIILDDVRSEDAGDWEPLWEPLTSAAERGIVIILTTRSHRVAQTKGHPWIHMVDRLSDEECWEIFTGWAFPGGDDSGEHAILRRLRGKIVEKSKGVPLLASIMGGLFGRYLLDERKLEAVLLGLSSSMFQRGDTWEYGVIGLIYHHLPRYLKLCFAYCSVFPASFIFDKSKLVQMWIAQGYIRPQKGRQLEDVGNDYFDDLYHSSLFQCIEGKYVMQDPVHDFAEKIIKGGCQIQKDEVGNYCVSQDIRHLSVSCDTFGRAELDKLRNCKRLRTFRLKCEGSPSHLDVLLAEYKHLRVLELECPEIVKLPSSIRRLKHLKYLDISKTAIKTPPELVNLRHLEWQNPSVPDLGSGTSTAILPPGA